MTNLADAIRHFVVTNFLFGQPTTPLHDTESFLESGVIDSTGVLELVGFLEQHFGITVTDRELIPENLDSVQSAAQFVARKLELREQPTGTPAGANHSVQTV